MRRTTFLAATAALLVLLPAAGAAAGDDALHLGLVQVWVHGSGGPAHNEVRPTLAGGLLGVPERFDSPGTRVEVEDLRTLALSWSRRLAPRWQLQLDLGIPPRVALRGQGVVAPPGPSGALFRVDLGDPRYQPLGSARQWSPVLALQYTLVDESARLQPYVGLGLSYTWFSHRRIDPELEAAVDGNFGQPLATAAGRPGPTSLRPHTESGFAPVLGAGLRYAWHPRWTLTAALGVSRFESRIGASLHAADGTQLARSHMDVRLYPVTAALLLGYRY